MHKCSNTTHLEFYVYVFIRWKSTTHECHGTWVEVTEQLTGPFAPLPWSSRDWTWVVALVASPLTYWAILLTQKASEF